MEHLHGTYKMTSSLESHAEGQSTQVSALTSIPSPELISSPSSDNRHVTCRNCVRLLNGKRCTYCKQIKPQEHEYNRTQKREQVSTSLPPHNAQFFSVEKSCPEEI